MLMTEKKITRVRVQLDDNEITVINDVNFLADCWLTVLEENGADGFVSTVTGEVIDADDIKRLKGILDGMLHVREWVLE